jgi:hypothetical protein
MTTIYEKGYGNLSIISVSGDQHLNLEHIGCAFEWRDNKGILYKADSLGMEEVRFSRQGRVIEAAFEMADTPRFIWKIIDDDHAVRLQAGIANTTGEYIRIGTIEPFYMDFSRRSRLKLNGGLLQAQLVSQRISDAMLTSIHIFEALYQYNSFYSDNMLSLHDKQGQNGLVLGFTNIKRMFGKILLEFDINLKFPLSFRAFSDAEDIPLAPGEKLLSEELWLSIDGLPAQQMESYAQYTGMKMGARRWFSAPTGWSTWDYYFGDINEEIILKNAACLQRDREDFPLNYIQIDAGYCDERRNWTEWDKAKFPRGPRWLVDRINEYGFKAGLWLIPFYAHPQSRVAQEHPEWLVKDREGKPVSYLESAFALDGSHPQVQAWLRKLAWIITHEWGFEYIKIDGASIIGITRGEHYDAAATGCAAYRQGIEAFRSGMKEGTLFMGGIFNVGIGVIDAMRTGGDVGARWDCSKIEVHRGERDRYHGSGYVKRAIMSALNGYFMHGKFWINDGDYLVVREDRSELTLNEARTWATILGLYGGSVILGDNMITLSPERKEVINKILPLYIQAAKPLDFLQQEIPGIMVLNIDREDESWKVVCLINYTDKTETKRLDFDAIGLDSEAEHHIYGFWEQKYYGLRQGSLDINLAAHACEVLSIRKDLKRPQIVGTDMHITQGGVEFKEVKWVAGRLSVHLSAKAASGGGRIIMHLPFGWTTSTGLSVEGDTNQGSKRLLSWIIPKESSPIMEVELTCQRQS